MNFPFRLASLVLFVLFVSACQPRIQPIYVPSSVALPPGLETAPLSVILDGILKADGEKGWIMEEREPGVIRASLGIRGKHESVVDVVYNNQSFDIKYVSSRNLLSQGARIHRSYNAWVRQLETSINNNLGYAAAEYKRNPAAATADAPTAAPVVTVFDPAGTWNVSATYSPTAMSASFCPKQQSWNFQLDYRKRGGIDETYWSNGVQLNVTGEHSEDHSELVFSVPDGGSNWQLTQRLKLDNPQVRLTSEPKSSTASNCVGVIDIVMKKQSKPVAAKSAPLVAAVPSTKAKFSAKGNWNVSVKYIPEASNTSWCPKAANWDFALTLKNGKISNTQYSNRKALYVSGEMDDDYLDLRFIVPRGGIDWKWTKRFILDQTDKRFSATSRGGAGGSGCTGAIDVHMKKQAQTVSAAPKPATKKTPSPVATTATAADIAWTNLQDKQDPAELRLFLKKHLDSKYAAVAILNLNEAMAGSSALNTTIQKSKRYDPSGNWRVSAEYTGSASNTSSCPKNPRWLFILTLPDDNLSKRIWDGANDLYIANEGYDDKTRLKIVFPRGGGDWKWAKRFELNQDQKTFLSESNGFGGTYGTCTGKLVFTMQKMN